MFKAWRGEVQDVESNRLAFGREQKRVARDAFTAKGPLENLVQMFVTSFPEHKDVS